MTPNKVIVHIDEVRPNAYDDETKLKWISDLDGMVKRLVMQETETVDYKFPEDLDTELLVPAPFDSVYALYVASMLDFHNKEYPNYNNSALMFQTRFDEYKKAYLREHTPKNHGQFKM